MGGATAGGGRSRGAAGGGRCDDGRSKGAAGGCGAKAAGGRKRSDGSPPRLARPCKWHPRLILLVGLAGASICCSPLLVEAASPRRDRAAILSRRLASAHGEGKMRRPTRGAETHIGDHLLRFPHPSA
ncbi:Os05g0268301 [Oryza sativa Japonica Group]|uniref:Os05g0268301 protein n=1 Tax=Oryza sativa subsp. japonica TaxID=39947 RepID=A0A0P0WK14_ORYSJ|nr:Os05g0268301 [Oryza sativa Japonica Group]